MTKRPVSPQAQSESNKRQRGEQATDGTSHSSSQLTQASVENLTKYGLMDIETTTPGSIRGWAMAARDGHLAALNNIAAALGLFDKDELVAIEAKAPGTIRIIARAASRGHPEAFNSLAPILKQLTKNELVTIETKASGTIRVIAMAARDGHPAALNNIAAALGLLSIKMSL